MAHALQSSIASLPNEPGIYRYYNSDQVLIYVGKAKELRKRVSSYFNKQAQHTRKTAKLVSEIARIEFTITNSEFDALLLENNFIKQHQPKYNILLKDDKTFPYLCIVHEPFPRIISTRQHTPGYGEYFGPYTSVVSMKSILELIRQLYTIRTCALPLSAENIEAGKFKVCLEYHIGNCLGPCIGAQPESDYLEDIKLARNILRGQLGIVRDFFQQQMELHAADLQFEKAELFKRKLELVDKFQIKSLVVHPKLTDIDVITITSTVSDAYLNYLQIKEGSIIYSKDLAIRKKLEETDEDLLSSATLLFREESNSTNPTLFSNVALSIAPEGVENVIPQIGDKRKLVELSLKNAMYARSKRETEKANAEAKKNIAVRALQNDLQLKNPPFVIECFDNSNLQGTNPVASMVRFVDGKPNKAGYRHFNIKTVVGPDDFASMNEIVRRRYQRLQDEGSELPDLIVIDGGKGQLHSACDALRNLGLYGQIPIVGIAKKLEEIYFPGDQ
ncbi:MAG: excinuclease ABC subunit UvrC, partial [Cyclobacteriaceae bacterium]